MDLQLELDWIDLMLNLIERSANGLEDGENEGLLVVGSCDVCPLGVDGVIVDDSVGIYDKLTIISYIIQRSLGPSPII